MAWLPGSSHLLGIVASHTVPSIDSAYNQLILGRCSAGPSILAVYMDSFQFYVMNPYSGSVISWKASAIWFTYYDPTFFYLVVEVDFFQPHRRSTLRALLYSGHQPLPVMFSRFRLSFCFTQYNIWVSSIVLADRHLLQCFDLPFELEHALSR